jgi:hypothetical protein
VNSVDAIIPSALFFTTIHQDEADATPVYRSITKTPSFSAMRRVCHRIFWEKDI